MAGFRDAHRPHAKSKTDLPAAKTDVARGRPRDAATLILVDFQNDAPRVLMGKRRADQIFLPNKFVFPGGRVDRADRKLASTIRLHPADRALLMRNIPARSTGTLPEALALAAVRETFEETGLIIGKPTARPPTRTWAPWQPFFASGHIFPEFNDLMAFARAITPPGRPRRYDTRFFVAPATAIAGHNPVVDGELSNLNWFTLAEMDQLDLPGITRMIVADLRQALPSLKGNRRRRSAIPFYLHEDGQYQRSLLRRQRNEP